MLYLNWDYMHIWVLVSLVWTAVIKASLQCLIHSSLMFKFPASTFTVNVKKYDNTIKRSI